MRTLLLILLIATPCHAQIEIVTGDSVAVKSTKAVVKSVENASPFVREVKPLREPQHNGYLESILCRIPEDYLKIYPDNLVTCGHEATHRLSSRLVTGQAGISAFYVVEQNKAYYFRDPEKIKMGHVRRLIPRNRQCDIYRLYLTMNEDFPMLLFDELNAFVNGAFVAKEYGDTFQLKYELANGYKLHYFCGALLVAYQEITQIMKDLLPFIRCNWHVWNR